MHYQEWGFRANPFATNALTPDEAGSRLMVDREDLISRLQKRLAAGSKITTVEGLNGVGKTSLINVATYRHFKARLMSEKGPVLVPCRKAFQLTSDEKPDNFKQKVLLEVAQTLLEQRDNLPIPRGLVRAPSNSSLDKWLNSPVIFGATGGASVLGFGLSGGGSQSLNSAAGFTGSGLEKLIADELNNFFPKKEDGGVVCIIDNLELLQTSKVARETLEVLRDTLLTLPGIRWVLCGALGIVHGVASSPRLEGYLHSPIEVHDLEHHLAEDIFNTRVAALRMSADARLPINAKQFVETFDLYRGNLRTVLSSCDEFCSWVAEEYDSSDLFSDDLFSSWLYAEMHNSYEAVKSELRPKAFEIFSLACKFGVFSPSDCAEFGYKTPSALRPQIKALEDVGVLRSAQDESDKRRKTIQVMPKGWRVNTYIEKNNLQHTRRAKGSQGQE